MGSVNLRDKEIEEKAGDNEHVVRVCFACVSVCVYMCMSVYMCIPVVFVGEVVYNGGADAGHAPLAVVPPSCDDRELRSTQTLLTIYTERGQRRTKHTHTENS